MLVSAKMLRRAAPLKARIPQARSVRDKAVVSEPPEVMVTITNDQNPANGGWRPGFGPARTRPVLVGKFPPPRRLYLIPEIDPGDY